MARINLTPDEDEILSLIAGDTGGAFAALQKSLNAVLLAESDERAFRAKRETATEACIPNNHVHRPRRPQGRKRRESGGGTGASLRNSPQDAKRLRSAKRDAEPLCMSEDVLGRNPRHAPGFPVGVLDLVGLSTYRRPADQR